MMTLDDRLDTIARLRQIHTMTTHDLERHLVERGDDAAAAELRDTIECCKTEIDAWSRDVDAILERRTRIAAELEKPFNERTCRKCGAQASPRSVGNIEDVLAFMSDADAGEKDTIEELVRDLQPHCASCFGLRLRGLEQLASMLASESQPD